MANQFFMLISDDHRAAKNTLEDTIRKTVREKFNMVLTQDVTQTAKEVIEVVKLLNLNSKSKPVNAEFYVKRNDFTGRHNMVYVPQLFQLVFYPVKEVSNV